VVVGDVADVSKVPSDFVFRIEVFRLVSCVYIAFCFEQERSQGDRVMICVSSRLVRTVRTSAPGKLCRRSFKFPGIHNRSYWLNVSLWLKRHREWCGDHHDDHDWWIAFERDGRKKGISWNGMGPR
jgi:hypothetical protein